MNIRYARRPYFTHMSMMAADRASTPGATAGSPQRPPFNGTIEEITHWKGGALKHARPWVNLGDRATEQRVNALLEEFRQMSERIFVITWEGTKIPRGAQVGDHVIAWTQNGIVSSEDGKMIGTYERTMEWGGPQKNAHSMIVFLNEK